MQRILPDIDERSNSTRTPCTHRSRNTVRIVAAAIIPGDQVIVGIGTIKDMTIWMLELQWQSVCCLYVLSDVSMSVVMTLMMMMMMMREDGYANGR